MTLCFSPSFLNIRLSKVRSCSSLQTLTFIMAGAGEDLSSFSGSAVSPTLDASNSQVEGAVADSQDTDDSKLGFKRPEMYKSSLAGTVEPYDRHIFLCYKNAESWPSRVEDAQFDRLPRLLAAVLKSRKNDIRGQTRLALCEGRDGTESSNGDILIFPEMVRYRGLTHFDVDNFVEDVLVKGTAWASGVSEALTGYHVFVCCHGSRDRRCGVCGPVLVDKFKEEIELRGLKDQVFVSPCSHVGGHKYAGNLIIFSQDSEGKVSGHWYGYVTPDDVPTLLDQHIAKGEIVEKLWRGQMGSSKERKVDDLKLQENGGTAYPNGANLEIREKETQGSSTKGNMKDSSSCCQGAKGFSCCRDERKEEKSGIENKPNAKYGLCSLSAWMETWEKDDFLAAAAVIGAVASIAVAYSFYKRL
ncbi:PREDICTED: uncharacterized protein LOC104593090 isoform X2 [Nelumbo nucifera]|uniref:Uncharacterized protein LOC104593090 isoform X2 n=1 Tax=Nelumbo nucifera TaxID=4432 RepID=A0A1U7ZE31_NELNU|nr:PREDICTED: uncharacterized protein LOC104593090 isoform X2 [Nelumbo nucifera]